MSYRVRYTRAAKDDIVRLYGFLVEQDLPAARKALDAIEKGVEFLQDFPFTCRKATPEDPLLREMIISFGARGYVVLFEIEDHETVTILAVRHQREEDYH
ncbi:type II toxin-antitoxin system RelE/ParE family toxin [Geothermobacter hydrogeniphilus]|uniref:Plasmid stabilization protein n=1 Tax=Geothermobacter hydrogeniphilus TaxID=1969733 RepID=A0A1X0Y0Q0_9BACT|nr:type II toxin-antitoxin system RelE/ParE family toxin [Geothermobacter hydrogeniphilus]ORJ58677.1 plasmid stabilization protein [Geothermobacter hydrogeniphilus]